MGTELRRCEICNQVTHHTHFASGDDPSDWNCTRCRLNGSRRPIKDAPVAHPEGLVNEVPCLTRKDFEAILEEYFSECINFTETPTHWVGKVWYLGMEFVVGYEKPGQPQGLFPHPWFAAIDTLGVNYGVTFEVALVRAAQSAIKRLQNNIKSLEELCTGHGFETSGSKSQ